MSLLEVITLIHLATGLFLAFIAYLIKYKQWSWLIAGYNTASKEEREKYDTSALCAAVGNLIFVLGGVCFIGALGEVLKIDWLITFCWIIFTLTTLVGIVYMNTGGRFKKVK
jgi:hypothetical protein